MNFLIKKIPYISLVKMLTSDKTGRVQTKQNKINTHTMDCVLSQISCVILGKVL